MVKQCGGRWNSKVEQCGGTVKQSGWNSGTVIMEQCGGTAKSHGGTLWWKSVIKQSKQSWWNSVEEHLNSHGGTVWWKSEPVMVGQCGGTVEQ